MEYKRYITLTDIQQQKAYISLNRTDKIRVLETALLKIPHSHREYKEIERQITKLKVVK